MKTAVEWLADRLVKIDFEDDPYYRDLFNKAKEMEKQQIIDAWDDGYEKGYGYLSAKFDSAEQYYNETFNDNPDCKDNC